MKLARVIKLEIATQNEGRKMTCVEKELIDSLLKECFVVLRKKKINAIFSFRANQTISLEYCPQIGESRIFIPRGIYNDVKKYLVENDFIVADLITNDLVVNRELKIELPQ